MARRQACLAPAGLAARSAPGLSSRFRADPEENISEDAEAGRGEPDHGGADESREQCPPRAHSQEQNRAQDDVDANGHVDAPLEIPTVGLQEIKLAVRHAERRLEAEKLERIADRAEAGERHVDGDQPGGDDAENPQRIDQHRQERAGDQHQAGDQPYRPLDVPAVGGNDINAFAHGHDLNLLRSRPEAYSISCKRFPQNCIDLGQNSIPTASNRLNSSWICTVHTRMRLKPRPGGSCIMR